MQAAVDGEFTVGAIGTLIAGKEQHQVRHFQRGRHAAHGHELQCLVHLAGHRRLGLGQHHGVDEARMHGVHAHAKTPQFFISPTGVVADSRASGVDGEVASCVAAVIKSIEFPKPKGGGGVQVNYPFIFKQSGQ